MFKISIEKLGIYKFESKFINTFRLGLYVTNKRKKSISNTDFL